MRFPLILLVQVWVLVARSAAQSEEEGWDAWGEWDACSVECDGALTHRTRQCPTNDCLGDASDEIICNEQPCQISEEESPDIGCFIDTWSHDLPNAKLEANIDIMTRVDCIDACELDGYYFAAVQNGKLCYCSNSYGRYGKATDEAECLEKLCTKDNAPLCGGYLRNSIFATSLARPGPAQVPCGNGGFQYGDSCFTFSTTEKPWDEAQQDCINAGGHLATINDAATQAFIEFTITEQKLHHDYWFGLNDFAQELDFVFADDAETPSTFAHFMTGKPTVASANCVELKSSSGYEWNDVMCTTAKRYICQASTTSTPTPDVTCGDNSEGFEYNSKCYVLIEDGLSWADAIVDCAKRNGMLASITDAGTHAFLYKHVVKSSSPNNWYFGLNDEATEGAFVFRDGTALDASAFNKYANGNPDDATSEYNLDCTVLSASKNYLWDDIGCSGAENYICELGNAPNSVCSPEWTEYNGHCYMYRNVGSSYQDSVDFCTFNGKAHLLKLDSVDELTWAFNTFAISNANVWVAMVYDAPLKDFMWFDGTVYGNALDQWDAWEPTSINKDPEVVNQDCVFLHKTTAKLRDNSCGVTYIKTICEMDPSA